jgi:hypothetical protein
VGVSKREGGHRPCRKRSASWFETVGLAASLLTMRVEDLRVSTRFRPQWVAAADRLQTTRCRPALTLRSPPQVGVSKREGGHGPCRKHSASWFETVGLAASLLTMRGRISRMRKPFSIGGVTLLSAANSAAMIKS